MNPPVTEPLLVNGEQGSTMLGVSQSTFRELVRRGEIEPVKINKGCVRYRTADIKALAGGSNSK